MSKNAQKPEKSTRPLNKSNELPRNGGESKDAALMGCAFPLRFNLAQHSLTETEKRVGEYFLKHPESVYLSITEVTQTSGLGYGSIIRFCRKIGCAGFQDFKVLLAQELRESEQNNQKTNDPVEAYLEKQNADLSSTVKLLDRNVLSQAARAICNAGFVMVGGIAGSAPLAHGFDYRLSRLGIASTPYFEGYTMSIRAATLKKGDVFIGMSFSGATKDLVHTAKIAAERKATVIGISAFSQSPLEEVAHYNLVGVSDRDPYSCEIFSNLTRDFVLDLLITEIIKNKPDSEEIIQKTFEAISDRRI